MRKLPAIASLLICLLFGPVSAYGVETPPFPTDYRIRTVQYSDNDVYTIVTKYGYQTNIVFGNGEEIQTISVGDRSMWQIIPSGNRLFIRPMSDGIDTNMTVLTNRHSYQFDIRSIGPKSGGNVYVVRFLYPEPRPPMPVFTPPPRTYAPPPPSLPAHQHPVPSPARKYVPPPAPVRPPATAIKKYTPPPEATAASPFNTNYTYTGDDKLAPLQVYDDGKSTFIHCREGQPPPGVYALDKNGKKRAVSFTVRDDTMMIHEIAPEWLLENASGEVHVYNETLEAQ